MSAQVSVSMPPNNHSFFILCSLRLFERARCRIIKRNAYEGEPVDIKWATKPLALIVVPALLTHAYYRWHSDFLRKLRGPNSSSFLYGKAGDCEFKWAREYGNVWRQHGCLGRDRLVLAGSTALRYILHVHGYHFDKPTDARKVGEMTSGKGLPWVNGS
ncbi:hypothetical protein EI94DRAFT_179815 [Lactarius quietus]|nr:hypothetical protein EI94DRAFT_179815 [Lactarius quietus]